MIFFKSLGFGEKDNVPCVDLSSIEACLISCRSSVLVDKPDPAGRRCCAKTATKQKGAWLSWGLTLKYLAGGRLFWPLEVDVM